MEIKVVLKEGDKSARFQFAGDSLDLIKGVTKHFSKVTEGWDEFVAEYKDIFGEPSGDA